MYIHTHALTLTINILPTPAHYQNHKYAQKLQPYHCSLDRKEENIKTSPNFTLNSVQSCIIYNLVTFMVFQFIFESVTE